MTAPLILEKSESENQIGKEAELRSKIEKYIDVYNYIKHPLIEFLLKNGIEQVEEMDYKKRLEFENYIEYYYPNKRKTLYLTIYDRVKTGWIKEQMDTLQGRRKCQWLYKNEVLFIPYHPDQQVRQMVEHVRYSENMVWDFSINCSEVLKKQIFLVLNEIIGMKDNSYLRGRRFKALKYLYQYCYKNEIADIEKMEMEQITDFYRYIDQVANNKKDGRGLRGILEYARSKIFIMSEEIHWDANIWYLKRFKFSERRRDETRPVRSLSFLEVRQKQNRKLLQEYMRYELGISTQALSVVKAKFYNIRNFLSEIEIYVVDLTKDEVINYINKLQEHDVEASTFNCIMESIFHFFHFLKVHGYIKKLPFSMEEFRKKEIITHHYRSIAFETCREILLKLNCFPEHLRLMFLHLWGIGLRISEVCVLKGNAYYYRERDAWIRVYQVKMKSYKHIPIPEMIYRYAQIYIKRNSIGSDEYLFQDSQGAAFKYATFKDQMKKYCEENGIKNGEYVFKAHDYRHTVATMFYEKGVSIQSIRDYLGHETDEMTEQYIDCIPLKIEKKNEEFFNKKENNLWSGKKLNGR